MRQHCPSILDTPIISKNIRFCRYVEDNDKPQSQYYTAFHCIMEVYCRGAVMKISVIFPKVLSMLEVYCRGVLPKVLSI